MPEEGVKNYVILILTLNSMMSLIDSHYRTKDFAVCAVVYDSYFSEVKVSTKLLTFNNNCRDYCDTQEIEDMRMRRMSSKQVQ